LPKYLDFANNFLCSAKAGELKKLHFAETLATLMGSSSSP